VISPGKELEFESVVFILLSDQHFFSELKIMKLTVLPYLERKFHVEP